MHNHKNQTKNLSRSSFLSSIPSRQAYNFSLSFEIKNANRIFSQLQQTCGLETNSSYLHRLVKPSSRYIMQYPARSQSPMLMLFPLRQLWRLQGFRMFLRYMIISACLQDDAGKLYQWRNDWKVLAFQIPACEWKGTCQPFLVIQNMRLSPHLQQVKVVGNLLANLATSQQMQLSSLTRQMQSGMNQLYPLTSSSDVYREVSHLAKARLRPALMSLGQKPYGIERGCQSCPLRPRRKRRSMGLFYEDFNLVQIQAFIYNHYLRGKWGNR